MKSKKISIDISQEMYDEVMSYGFKNKIYKFGPTILTMLRKVLDQEKEK